MRPSHTSPPWPMWPSPSTCQCGEGQEQGRGALADLRAMGLVFQHHHLLSGSPSLPTDSNCSLALHPLSPGCRLHLEIF